MIGHVDAPFLGVLSGAAPSRSRAEVRALAQRIYTDAQAKPEAFAELVLRYTELRHRVRGGDFGTCSNREPAPFPREIELLDQLSIGEVRRPSTARRAWLARGDGGPRGGGPRRVAARARARGGELCDRAPRRTGPSSA